MEEIDTIIIESLQNLHCDFEETVTSLKHFDADMIVTAISTCLETIIPNSTFPKKLPPSMSLKLKITSDLAQRIKELGFRGDMGYQTILYCNEAEIRRVLMFLIERLPRESNKTHAEPTGYVPTLVKEIEQQVRYSLDQFWLPSYILDKGYCQTNMGYSLGTSTSLSNKKLKIPCSKLSRNNDALKKYWIHSIPDVTKQCTHQELLPSLLFDDFQVNANSVHLKSAFQSVKNDEDLQSHAELLDNSNSCIPENSSSQVPQKEVIHNKINQLVGEFKTQRNYFINLQADISNCEMQLSQVTSFKGDEEDVLKSTLAKVNLKSKTLTVISKKENLQKLKNLIESNNMKLLHLTDQWNEIQIPLLDEYKSLQNTLSSEDVRVQEQRAKLKKLQETYKILTDDFQDKLVLEDQLKEKLEQLNKNHNRAGYTKRILEIIDNVKRQDDEIQKILKDTREVQREISMLTGQVDRSFTLSDELIFRDAKQDEIARKAYKLLAQLREECVNIIKAVTDLGLIERESRNLQEQIDSESTRETVLKLEKVNKDMLEIKKETKSLLSQI